MPLPGFSRQLASEFVGTAGLLMAVVGSGIAVSRAAESDAIGLFIHAIVVGFALIALIAALAPWSNHFNPAVTFALWRSGRVEARRVAPLMGAQIAGALVGVILANLMFGEIWVAIGDKPRTGFGLWLVRGGTGLPLEAGLALERELQQRLFESRDAAEGIAAFLEKRPPEFEGR